jgi:hypothetical protein
MALPRRNKAALICWLNNIIGNDDVPGALDAKLRECQSALSAMSGNRPDSTSSGRYIPPGPGQKLREWLPGVNEQLYPLPG